MAVICSQITEALLKTLHTELTCILHIHKTFFHIQTGIHENQITSFFSQVCANLIILLDPRQHAYHLNYHHCFFFLKDKRWIIRTQIIVQMAA